MAIKIATADSFLREKVRSGQGAGNNLKHLILLAHFRDERSLAQQGCHQMLTDSVQSSSQF